MKNILNFGYGINYKYEGRLTHSFDRFCVVTKFILPSIGDLKFSKLNYDNMCAYLDNKNAQNTEARKYARRISVMVGHPDRCTVQMHSGNTAWMGCTDDVL